MDAEAWANGFAKSLMIFLNGDAIPEVDRRGQSIHDDSFLVVFNGHDEPITFTIPETSYGEQWFVEVDTAASDPATALTGGAAGHHRRPGAGGPGRRVGVGAGGQGARAGRPARGAGSQHMVLRCPRAEA